MTFGKSRVRESRMLGSVRAKSNGLATRPRPGVLFTVSKRYQRCIRINVGEHWTEARTEGLKAIGHGACILAQEPGVR